MTPYGVKPHRSRYARKARAKTRRAKPSANPNGFAMDKQGGVLPRTTFELLRAKVADLGTLPKTLCGTSCGSCSYFKKGSGKVGHCKHPLLQMAVTARMCCAFYDNRGYLRPTKAASK